MSKLLASDGRWDVTDEEARALFQLASSPTFGVLRRMIEIEIVRHETDLTSESMLRVSRAQGATLALERLLTKLEEWHDAGRK